MAEGLSKSISVVVPNYNGKQLLEENIPLLLTALKNTFQDYEIIISDDASTDDSVSFIRKNYPEIILIQSEKNAGFSPTINKGIMQAKKDLVFALNSDVKLTPDYFKAQLVYFNDAQTFGVMGRIIGIHDDQVQDGAKYPAMVNLTLKSTYNYLFKIAEENKRTPTLFLSGANALMDRKKVQMLKGFDEAFSPFYGEDVDLSLRAWRLGWKCYYENNSVCRHPASTTIASYHKKKKIRTISLRNKMIFHNIHLEGWERFIWNTILAANLLGRWAMGQFYFYTAFGEFIKRKEIIAKSKMELDACFSALKNKLSVREVVKEIKKEIGNDEIIKF